MDVILVATWYPAVDDPARGRFVADQADALRRTGEVRPVVVSFDPASLDEQIAARPADMGAVSRIVTGALAVRPDAVSPAAFGLGGDIPIARLPALDTNIVSEGLDGESRRLVLEAVASSLPIGSGSGIVHAHTGYPDGYAASFLARHLGWPLVITEHASFVSRQLREPAQRDRYLAAVRAADRFVAVSEVLAGELRAAIPQLAGKLVVIPNAIPIDQFRLTGRAEREPDELLFVGYRKASKGIPTLLRAFAEVRAARPAATLRLVGKSPTDGEEARWQEMSRALGIEGAVHFEPPADRAGVAAAMSHASLFVHPSPRETFGITTLEALASGLPVVAARSGGISSILEDPELGELVPAGDAHALAAGVLRALDRTMSSDPAYLRAAVEPFSDRAVAERLVLLYRQLCGPTASGESPGDSVREPVPVAQPVPAQVAVLGVDTRKTTRLVASLPIELRRRVILITGDAELASDLRTDVARIVPLPLEAVRRLYTDAHSRSQGRVERRLRRSLRGPLWLVRRVRAHNPVVERRRAEARAAVCAATVGAVGQGDAPELICVDAIDYWIAEPMIAAGAVQPVPGGLLWLADRWAASQAGRSPSR